MTAFDCIQRHLVKGRLGNRTVFFCLWTAPQSPGRALHRASASVHAPTKSRVKLHVHCAAIWKVLGLGRAPQRHGAKDRRACGRSRGRFRPQHGSLDNISARDYNSQLACEAVGFFAAASSVPGSLRFAAFSSNYEVEVKARHSHIRSLRISNLRRSSFVP